MLRKALQEMRDRGFVIYAERGRITATRQNDGFTIHYFPELGSWYAQEDDRLIQVPMLQSGLPSFFEDGEINAGEVTVFNEASAVETAIIRHYFGSLSRTAYTGR